MTYYGKHDYKQNPAGYCTLCGLEFLFGNHKPPTPTKSGVTK